MGGTILGTSNRGNPFAVPSEGGVLVDRSREVVERLAELEVDAVVGIGGDGSMRIAAQLMDMGVPVVGVPKTIDNDLEATDLTFGFDSALHVATDAIDRLHSTAESHHRVMLVEVMGRHAGWIALEGQDRRGGGRDPAPGDPLPPGGDRRGRHAPGQAGEQVLHHRRLRRGPP